MAGRIRSVEQRGDRRTPDSRCKCRPSFSSILLSAFTNVSLNDAPQALAHGGRSRRRSFSAGKFKGLGCSSQAKVSVPAAIRDSADWQTERLKKKKQRSILLKKGKRTTTERGQASGAILDRNSVHVVPPDIWCSPGIGFSADDASVDCVISRRSMPGRGRIASENVNFCEQHQHSYWGEEGNRDNSYTLEPCFPFGRGPSLLSVHDEGHNRRIRHRISDGFAEMMLFQSGLLLGGRPTSRDDNYRELRLDVDNMSYEELLELGDRIGNVSTGLMDEEIRSCLRKTRFSMPIGWPYHSPATEFQLKCSICQEEYKEGEDVGKLECGHGYHMGCIRQWLLRKNACPVCKTMVSAC